MAVWDLEIDGDKYYTVGEIIKLRDGNFRVTKVTRSAIAVERYYFFDAWWDWLARKLNGRKN